MVVVVVVVEGRKGRARGRGRRGRLCSILGRFTERVELRCVVYLYVCMYSISEGTETSVAWLVNGYG